jgi:hypothetical protein
MLATLVSGDTTEATVVPMVGVWSSLNSAGVWSQAVGFVLVRLA